MSLSRVRGATRLVFALALVLSSVFGVTQGKRVALLIGVSKHHGHAEDLDHVEVTQAMVRTFLSERQFAVTPLIDVTRTEAVDAIRKAGDLQFGDVLVLMIHSHGAVVDKYASFSFYDEEGKLDPLSSLDVGNLLKQPLGRGVNVTLLVETCYAGATLSATNSSPLVSSRMTGDVTSQSQVLESSIIQTVGSKEGNATPAGDRPTALQKGAEELTGTLTILSASKGDEKSFALRYPDHKTGSFFPNALVKVLRQPGLEGKRWSEVMPVVRQTLQAEFGPYLMQAVPPVSQSPLFRGADTMPFEALKKVPPVTFGQLRGRYAEFQAEDSSVLLVRGVHQGKPLDDKSQVVVTVGAPSAAQREKGQVVDLTIKVERPGWLFVADWDGEKVLNQPIGQFSNQRNDKDLPDFVAAEGAEERVQQILAGAQVAATDTFVAARTADRVGVQHLYFIQFFDEEAARHFANLSASSDLLVPQSTGRFPSAPRRTYVTAKVQFQVVESLEELRAEVEVPGFGRLAQSEEGLTLFGPLVAQSTDKMPTYEDDGPAPMGLLVGSTSVITSRGNRVETSVPVVEAQLRAFFGEDHLQRTSGTRTLSEILDQIRGFLKQHRSGSRVIYLTTPGTILRDGRLALALESSDPRRPESYLLLADVQKELNAAEAPDRVFLVLDTAFRGAEQPDGSPDLAVSHAVNLGPLTIAAPSSLFEGEVNFEYFAAAPPDGLYPLVAQGGSPLLLFLIDLAKPVIGQQLAKFFDWLGGRLGVKKNDRAAIANLFATVISKHVDQGLMTGNKDTLRTLFPDLLKGFLELPNNTMGKFMNAWKFMVEPRIDDRLRLRFESKTGIRKQNEQEVLSLEVREEGFTFIVNVLHTGHIQLVSPTTATRPELDHTAEEILARSLRSAGDLWKSTHLFDRKGVEAYVAVQITDKGLALKLVELLKSKGRTPAGFGDVQKWLLQQVFAGTQPKIRYSVANMVVM